MENTKSEPKPLPILESRERKDALMTLNMAAERIEKGEIIPEADRNYIALVLRTVIYGKQLPELKTPKQKRGKPSNLQELHHDPAPKIVRVAIIMRILELSKIKPEKAIQLAEEATNLTKANLHKIKKSFPIETDNILWLIESGKGHLGVFKEFEKLMKLPDKEIKQIEEEIQKQQRELKDWEDSSS